MSISAT